MRRCMLAAFLVVVLAAPAFAQSAQPAAFPQKDPAVATLLSFIVPGGGQIYAGRGDRGAVLLGLSAGSVAIGAFQSTTDGGWHARPLKAGLGIATAAWLYGLATAWMDAKHYNDAHAVAEPAVTPAVKRAANGRTLVGVSFAFGR